MPRPKRRIPTPNYHKPSGQVRVRLGGKDHYCGPWEDEDSHKRAERLIADWLSGGNITAAETAKRSPGGLSVAELAIAFIEFCGNYYVRAVRLADGSIDHIPTRELDDMKDAVREVRALHGKTPVAEFGPLKLKEIREILINRGLSRPVINQRIGRMKRMFKWGVENELVPPGVYHGLQAVAGLKRGRSRAPEPPPVKPVDAETVNATLPYLSNVVAGMVKFHAATGCRPGEVCQIRPRDVERDGEIWTYTPESHKTQHHGHGRTVFIGPKGQRALAPFLDNRPADAFCFSPAEAEQEMRARREAERKTPRSCGNRRGTNRTEKPRRKPGEAYNTQSYGRSIRYAVDTANKQRAKENERREEGDRLPPIPRWTPNQLRHAAATAIRREFGLEAAQVSLGHAAADVTQVYAERDAELARKVALSIG